jgi:hypothetical protein
LLIFSSRDVPYAATLDEQALIEEFDRETKHLVGNRPIGVRRSLLAKGQTKTRSLAEFADLIRCIDGTLSTEISAQLPLPPFHISPKVTSPRCSK